MWCASIAKQNSGHFTSSIVIDRSLRSSVRRCIARQKLSAARFEQRRLPRPDSAPLDEPMKRFDSLVHATRDGRWLGPKPCDASLGRLISELDRAECARACLVALAEHVDN